MSVPILYFDCISGISGNMILGALFDLGVSQKNLEKQLQSLPIEPWEFNTIEVKRGPFRTTWCEVVIKKISHKHNHLHDIEEIIDRGNLPDTVKMKSKKVFNLLAQAEGRVHGIDPMKVGFHEVGAIDSIIDIVGVCASLEMLGVEKIVCSPILLGRGEISSMHGKIPIPAPATLELLENVPIKQINSSYELTTPTGAALMKTFSEEFGFLPDMVVKKIAYGAGDDRPGTLPNVLRIISGETSFEKEQILILETNIDNTTAEDTGFVLEELLTAGALDSFLTSIQMKKSRMAQKLTVLCKAADKARIEDLIFSNLPTLGIRSYPVSRKILFRRIVKFDSQWGVVRIKQSEYNGKILHSKIEYEDLKVISKATGIGIDPLRIELMAQFRKKG